MKITHIVTGDELLRGFAVNLDSAIIGRALASQGMALTRVVHVGDEFASLCAALTEESRVCDLLLVTGGLGPTRDDLTRDAAAEAFSHPLRHDPALVAELTCYYRNRNDGEEPDECFLRQAMLPEGASAVPNPNGTAPGIVFSAGNTLVFLLPGPPFELEGMFASHVLPRIAELCATQAERHVTSGFLVPGGGERVIESLLAGQFAPNVGLAYCPSSEGTRVFLTTDDANHTAAEVERARMLLSEMTPFPADVLNLATEILRRLRTAGWRLSVAESCTAGLLGGEIASWPGASDVFSGGVIAYANEIKESLLDVPRSLLVEHGAVSAECAEAMAIGVAKRLQTECAAAITGIAGPGGGTAQKPVGLVYTAAYVDGEVLVREHHFRGGREAVRDRAKSNALLTLLALLERSRCPACKGQK